MQKSNPNLDALIGILYAKSEEKNVNLWRDVAKRLSKPIRNWATPNVGRISRVTEKGDVILVPGKVLGAGLITHPVEVYAYSISEGARTAITNAGGKFASIEALMKKNPTGKGVRIIK